MSERLAGMPRAWGRNPTAVSRFRRRGAPFWIMTVMLVVFFLFGVANLAGMVLGVGVVLAALGLVLWVLWTMLGAWLLGLVDVYRQVPWSTSLAMILWGAFPAALVAGNLEGVVPPFLGAGYTTAITAGLFEEGMKLLGIILVAAMIPVLFRRPMGALICAMMVGLGFSAYENVGYTFTPLMQSGPTAGVAENLVTLLEVFVIRGFVNGALAHMVFSGIACMGVFYFLSRTAEGSPGRRWGVAITLYLLAALVHAVNDMPLTSGTIGQVFDNAVQLVVFVGLIGYAVRVERRWFAGATGRAEPVVDSEEARTLRSRRARHRARTVVSDPSRRGRMKTMQWAQIGYVDAVAEGAPEYQAERLASYAGRLRGSAESGGGSGRIPGPRRPSPSDERRPTSESPG